jgi:hypothetical protein
LLPLLLLLLPLPLPLPPPPRCQPLRKYFNQP